MSTEEKQADGVLVIRTSTATVRIRPDPTKVRFFYRFSRMLLRIFYKNYLRIEAVNIERVPESGPFLILSNHASFLDPVLSGVMLEREMYFLARTGVYNAPIVGPLLRAWNSLPIRRGGVDREGIKMCAAFLRAGWPIVLFPEGTRSVTGEVAEPKGGFGMILEQVPDLPLLPIYIEGTHRAWGKGMLLPRPRKVRVTYGEPFVMRPKGEAESRRDYYNMCAERLREAWTEIGAYEFQAGD